MAHQRQRNVYSKQCVLLENQQWKKPVGDWKGYREKHYCRSWEREHVCICVCLL